MKKYFRWFAVSTCPPGQVLASPDMSEVRVWSNFARFGSKIELLTKFLNDSAWLCLVKLKNQSLSTKNLKILPKIKKTNIRKSKKHKNIKFPRDPPWSQSVLDLYSGIGNRGGIVDRRSTLHWWPQKMRQQQRALTPSQEMAIARPIARKP